MAGLKELYEIYEDPKKKIKLRRAAHSVLKGNVASYTSLKYYTDEVLQQAFLETHCRLTRVDLEPIRCLAKYLFVTVSKIALKFLFDEGRTGRDLANLAHESQYYTNESFVVLWEKEEEFTRNMDLIRRIAERLGTKYVDLLSLWLKGYRSNVDIANELEVNVDAIRIMKQKLMRHLKKHLKNKSEN